MRVRLVAVMLLLIFGFSMIRVSEAVTTITVSIDPPVVPGRVGKNVSFDVSISGIDESVLDLYAWEFKLRWTDTEFNFVDAQEGPFLEQGGQTSFVVPKPVVAGVNETVTVGCSLTGYIPGVRGSGVLATVTLYVVGGTTGSFFDLLDIELRNSALEPIEPPDYDVDLVDVDAEFARARSYDIEHNFGVVDIYDLGAVTINYGRNVIRPTSIATTWAVAAGGGWSNPEAAGASDNILASESTLNDAEKWMSFRFNTTEWTGVSKVELGLERRVDSGSGTILIAISTDNGNTWSPTTFPDTVNQYADALVWIDVTTAYTPGTWTKTMVENIAVRLTRTAGILRLDYLVFRVTPTPALGGNEAFDPDADVNYDRTIDIDDLVILATNYGEYEL